MSLEQRRRWPISALSPPPYPTIGQTVERES